MRTDGPTLISALVLAVLLPIAALAQSPAQDSQDPRFAEAQRLFADPTVGENAEKACQIMNDLIKEKPSSDTFKRFQRLYCSQVEHLHNAARDVYNQGMQAAKSDACDQAQAKLTQISSLETKNVQYLDDLKHAVADCRHRADDKKQEEANQKRKQEQQEEAKYNQCLEFENGRKYDDAQGCFEQISQAGGAKAGEARHHLDQLPSLRMEQAAFDKALGLYRDHAYSLARDQFEAVKEMGGKHQAEANHYLALIGQEEKKSQKENSLRSGLRSYFESDFEQAERSLTEYLRKGGEKQWVAYFFIGAAHSSRYLLSQDGNKQEKQQAWEGFHAAKTREKKLSSTEELNRVKAIVSRRIWDLYLEAP